MKRGSEDAVVFVLLVAASLASALFSVIDDCDEVYNYWEPVHLLLYGSGFQTWEYSPAFALRSYWYPGVMALVGWPLKLLLPSKLWVFFGLRATLGLLYAWCATFFYVSARACLDIGEVRALLAASLMALPGFFAASTALLPNSLTMCLLMVSLGCWLRGLRSLAVIVGAASVLLGVPFAIVILIPMALRLVQGEGLVPVAVWGAIGSVLSLGPQLLVDRWFYGKWVFAVANIVFYNALSGETDSTLYGIEPLSFYHNNLMLNLTVVYPMAAMGLLGAFEELFRSRRSLRAWIGVSAGLWLMLMSFMPHKEQRFLYPVYPLLVLSACAGISQAMIVLTQGHRARLLVGLLVAAVLVTSASRIVAVHRYRSGTMTVWHGLQQERNKTLCMGMDWYRFPSSFWLPDDSVRLEFVKSRFTGLLPKHFAQWPDATRAIPSGMNNRNREETDRYVSLEKCDLMVEEGWAWKKSRVVAEASILDSAAKPSFFRAFYVPFVSDGRVARKKYAIVRTGK
jgi:alpha-1,2-mannosyltransferase